MIAGSFTIVSTLGRSAPALEHLVHKYGFERRCRRVRTAEVPVLALEEPGSGAVDRLRAEIAAAVAEDRCEAIVLGCAGMADLNAPLAAEFGLPVIDGVAAAVKLVEAVVGLGLGTSKALGYAAPLAKRYDGLMERFQPCKRRAERIERRRRSFDFYDAHYRQLRQRARAAAMRREIYGEDLGQTGWRSVAEQAEIAAPAGARTRSSSCSTSAAAPAARTLALAERTGCSVTGLDIEAAGIAHAQSVAAARALSRTAPPSWRRIAADRCRSPMATFDAVLCVDAINHLPDRPGTLTEWARLLRPGGRLLFTDALVVTGPLSKPEIDVRSGLGFYLFVPPGVNEAAIAGAGLSCCRWPTAPPPRPRSRAAGTRCAAAICPSLEPLRGPTWCEQRQRFLAVTAELARSAPAVALPLSGPTAASLTHVRLKAASNRAMQVGPSSGC